MDALEGEEAVRFRERLVASVRENFPAKVENMTEQDLQACVAEGIAKARSYSLTWESAIADFVGLMFDVAPTFDQHPDVYRILRDERISPNQRVDSLFRDIDDDVWDAIRNRWDEAS